MMWSARKGSANKDVHRNAAMGQNHPSLREGFDGIGQSTRAAAQRRRRRRTGL
jgi:hypothetical protein